ncbi:MAG: hypothetical protein N3E49_05130 [Bacteroidia bacterium]|nr:hypothetical protein [Bacteroidia bacterium]
MQIALNEAALRAYQTPLHGQNLPAITLPELLVSAPFIWMQFLRHLGCIYCKGLVQDIRAFIERWNGRVRPKLIFVHPNTLEEGRRFFEEFYPGASFIADPELNLYRLFQVRRASFFQQIHVSNLLRLWTLLRRGLSNDRPKADPWLLQAAFLFHRGKLVWSYYAKTFSDVPDWKRLL